MFAAEEERKLKVRYREDFPINSIDGADEEFQSRLDYDEEEIERLARDIEENGQRNPIGVRKKEGGRYQIIYGFQRVKAIKLLGKDTVKANVYEGTTDPEAREQSISDNLRHSDLTDVEKALACLRLKEKGYSTHALCGLFGAKKSTIYNYITAARLDPTTRYCIHKGIISLNHGVELARVKEVSKRLETLRQVVGWRYSVRDLKRWLADGESPIVALPVNGWIQVCPKSLKMESLEDCENCEHYKGRGEGGRVACSYAPTLEPELLPLITRRMPPSVKFVVPSNKS